MIHTIGLFGLVDPPDGAVEVLEDAHSHIEFPWESVSAGLATKSRTAIPVLFEELDQNTLGTYTRYSTTIRMTTTYGYNHYPFTFAHEVGHLVDHLILTDRQRAEILAEMLKSPTPYHYLEAHTEEWNKPANPYAWRINEAWADLFVAAFVPVLWGDKGPYSRFQHWVTDYAWVRSVSFPSLPVVPIEKDAVMFIAKVKNTAPVFLFTNDRYEHIVSKADLNLLSTALDLPLLELSPAQWAVFTASRTQVPTFVPGTWTPPPV